MSEANIDLVRLAAETHNVRDREQFLACYGAELLVRWGERELVVSPDEHWSAVLAWAETFEGFAEEIQQIMTEGDLVFLRSRYTGVHRGEWNGVPATGRSVTWDAWQVLRITNGLIVEERMLMDEWSLHQQLTSAEQRRGEVTRTCTGLRQMSRAIAETLRATRLHRTHEH